MRHDIDTRGILTTLLDAAEQIDFEHRLKQSTMEDPEYTRIKDQIDRTITALISLLSQE